MSRALFAVCSKVECVNLFDLLRVQDISTVNLLDKRLKNSLRLQLSIASVSVFYISNLTSTSRRKTMLHNIASRCFLYCVHEYSLVVSQMSCSIIAHMLFTYFGHISVSG